MALRARNLCMLTGQAEFCFGVASHGKRGLSKIRLRVAKLALILPWRRGKLARVLVGMALLTASLSR